MSAITDQANRFADTPVGSMVKWIIIYKICKGLVLGLLAIALTWFALLVGNLAVYFLYVRNLPQAGDPSGADGRVFNDRDNLTRRDTWLTIMVISPVVGIATTWITLVNIS